MDDGHAGGLGCCIELKTTPYAHINETRFTSRGLGVLAGWDTSRVTQLDLDVTNSSSCPCMAHISA